MVACHLPAELVALITQLAGGLHLRLAWRLLPLVHGMLFAQGRRTVASWLRGGGLTDYKPFYYLLGALGRRVDRLASHLLRYAVGRLPSGDRLLFALDDTPTKRYGPLVEGAGIHHNPTPGPAGQQFLYGHVWVTVAWVVRHAAYGTIGLPLRALLYIRKKDFASLPGWYGVVFRTKLEMAVELIRWLAEWLRFTGKTIWLVADGAYAKRPVLQAVREWGVVLVSRLRKDAALWSLPEPTRPGAPKKRGRPAIYGKKAISLAKRAGQARGWETADFDLYGEEVRKRFKTFLATYPPAGGVIRVVLVQERTGWVAFFCTDPDATVQQILEAFADRAAIEQDFHDLKEVHGTGEQQVRNYFANVAVYHLNLWLHTLIELWAWDKPQKELCDRSASPWDDPTRRPSHADRRNALRRQCLEAEYQAAHGGAPAAPRIRALFDRLRKLLA